MLERLQFASDGVFCTYCGHASLHDILDAAQQYLTHPDCSRLRYIVHDFSAIATFAFDEAHFAELGSYALQHYQDADQVPRCAVTQSETVRRSLGLYAEITGRGWEFVATLAEAQDWASGLHTR